MSSLTDKSYRYRNAEQSRKPGYLARRFAEIRKAERELCKAHVEAITEDAARNLAEAQDVVRPLKKKVRG